MPPTAPSAVPGTSSSVRERPSRLSAMLAAPLAAARRLARRARRRDAARTVSLLEATLEATADGILVLDAEDRITDANRQFAEMWGSRRAPSPRPTRPPC